MSLTNVYPMPNDYCMRCEKVVEQISHVLISVRWTRHVIDPKATKGRLVSDEHYAFMCADCFKTAAGEEFIDKVKEDDYRRSPPF